MRVKYNTNIVYTQHTYYMFMYSIHLYGISCSMSICGYGISGNICIYATINSRRTPSQALSFLLLYCCHLVFASRCLPISQCECHRIALATAYRLRDLSPLGRRHHSAYAPCSYPASPRTPKKRGTTNRYQGCGAACNGASRERYTRRH